MRILISALSCNATLGSEALVGYKYAEVLARRHEVVVLASPPCQVPPGAVWVPCNAGRCTFNDIEALPLLRFELRQLRIAKRLCADGRFHLVHRVTPSAARHPSLLPRLGIPLVIGPLITTDPPPPAFETVMRRPVANSVKSRMHPQRLIGGLARRVVAHLAATGQHLHKARCILAGTNLMVRRLPEQLRDRCREIPYCGVELDTFTPSDRQGNSGPLRVLHVGRVIPYKGVEPMLRAVALASKGCNLHLQVVGSEDHIFGSYCRRLTHELGIADLVEFRGAVPREQLPAIFRQADIFCFPSLCESFGVVLIEAMSCGCPVIVTDNGGPGEIINGNNGLKIPLRTPEQYIHDYASAIVALTKNQSLRARLGAAARQSVLRKHDWGRIGDQLLSVFEKVVQ